jgi:aldose 1-epimerase
MNSVSKNDVKQTSFNGMYAYELNCYPYQAVILPKFGANLIAFRNVEKDYDFIREPSIHEMEDFQQKPFLYGIPVLFPPNRLEDGTFTFSGKVYHFPINEKSKNNHLHGFFHSAVWEVFKHGSTDRECFIELVQSIDEQSEVFRYFPHRFKVHLRYTLSKEGLNQQVKIINKGSESMPLMIGFHTSIKAPFSKNSTAEDYTLQLTIQDRVELNERSLPTGNLLPLNKEEKKIATEGFSPYYQPLDHHYVAQAQKDGKNRMVLTDQREKISLIYETSSEFRFWMLFNQDAKSGFFCPEPQTNMVNAPNIPLPFEQTGMIELSGGSEWSAQSRLYTEPF